MAESVIRLVLFFGVFAVLAIVEYKYPKRQLLATKSYRWYNNLAVSVTNVVLVRLLFPSATVGFAIFAQTQQWGLFNLVSLAPVPLWLSTLVSLVFLDWVIWLQHLAFHKVPWLWRLHRMHHADQDIDLSTGLRFHPVEILLSMLIKAAAIIALGVPPLAALMFEVILNATSMFNHSNLRLPEKVDAWLRLVVVTPDMHRVHHSVLPRETHSNFGFNTPWWDRLSGTYRAQPQHGHLGMSIGLPYFRQQRDQRYDRLLAQPFLKEKVLEP